MKRALTHLLTSVVLGLALVCLATAFSEAQSKIIHVIATLDQVDPPSTPPVLGDLNTANADLADPQGHPAGTLASHCTIISVPPRDLLEQCLITAVFPDGQIVFGGIAVLPTPELSAEFSVLGGTGRYSKARGVVQGFVNPSGTTADFVFTLD